MFEGAARSAIAKLAQEIGVEPAALLAVAEAESGGKAFANIDGKPMPLIRWEGHYFYRLIPKSLQKTAVEAGLANHAVGGVVNPGSQQGRYDLLKRARQLNDEAALSSCSWGLGQVMGAHWSWLEYKSAQALVDDACSGIVGQVRLMAKFIDKSKLADELKQRDWAAFARQYNGPSYIRFKYNTKMATAYSKYKSAGAPAAAAKDDDGPTILRMGVSGADVSLMQEKLRKIGYNVTVDGDFGPATKRAVMNFQSDYGLPNDGVVDPLTWSIIERLQGTPV
jgi:N-acetylmuramidase/Putative peptidoglycan binding domain